MVALLAVWQARRGEAEAGGAEAVAPRAEAVEPRAEAVEPRGEAGEPPGAAGEPEAAEAALAACVAAARAGWPDLALDDAAFVAALADKAGSRGLAGLASLHTGDLFLATACAAGDVEALNAFERHLTAVRPALRRIDPSEAFADEVLQLVREKLFVWVGEAPPRIVDYAATGPIAGWVRVAVMRTALNQKRGRAARASDEATDLLGGGDTSLEIGYVKARYREAFQAAFEASMAVLQPAERTLLRLHFVDGLSIDKLAVVEQRSRSTVARRLVELRARLALATKAELRTRLGIAGKELDSMVGLLQSQLELSLSRILG